jgi:hypothetical protein
MRAPRRSTLHAAIVIGLFVTGLLLLAAGFAMGSILAVLNPEQSEQYRTIGNSLGGAGLFTLIVAWFVS